MHYLYYAGMPADKVHEQIGLAISGDGSHYVRVNGDGLVVKLEEKLNWKNLRVCNPTVICCDKKFVMFYQGIAKNLNTAIGMAGSDDGVNFRCADAPCLSLVDMIKVDHLLDTSKVVRLIEPSVLVQEGKFRMWFVYVHESHPGNAIYYAESSDGGNWAVFEKKVLWGNQFGNFNLHYPQVIKCEEQYELWFTLRDNASYVFGIFRMVSDNGLDWKHLRQVLPKTQPGRISLNKVSSFAFGLRHNISTVKSAYKAVFSHRPNVYGVAHPHVTREGDHRVLYYQNGNAGPRGLYFSIGKGTLEEDDRVSRVLPVLSHAENRDAWDAFFVADPYVLEC